MNINYEKFSRTLPCKECPYAKRQRDDVWNKWDANGNGFLSLKEIQGEFLEMFGIEEVHEISEIIKQCSNEAKRQYQCVGNLGQNYLEKRQFRKFLQYLHKHIKSLLLFEALTKNKQIGVNELIEATNVLIKKSLGQQEQARAKSLSRERKITFDTFQKWLTSLNFYNTIGDVSA